MTLTSYHPSMLSALYHEGSLLRSAATISQHSNFADANSSGHKVQIDPSFSSQVTLLLDLPPRDPSTSRLNQNTALPRKR